MAGSIIVDNINGYNISVGQVLCSAGKSLADNGYQKLSNGLIVQWGITSGVSANTTTSVTFPIAFPTACLQAFSGGGTTNSNGGGSFSAISTTGGTFFANSINNGQANRYFAIGY